MSTKWKPSTIYFCGELDEQTGAITKPILVMFIETELRKKWAEGKMFTVSGHQFVSVNREVDRKTEMVTYQLKEILNPSPLQF